MISDPLCEIHSSSFDGLCGVVVTYHPSGDIQRRLEMMADIVDKLVIIDNSADSIVLSILHQVADHHGALLIVNQNNMGIATALNQGVVCAQKQGAKWVLFFDQDSRPVKAFRQEMCRVLSEYVGQHPPGIIGCNYIVEGQASIMFPVPVKPHSLYVAVDSVITSGSLHRVEMFEKIGLFKDEYFIDLVDIEYCWRAARYGYEILRTVAPLMEHAIGRISKHSILGYKTGTSNHDAFRRYFMARNSIFLAKDYFTVYPIKAIRVVFSRFKSTILMCLFENEKVRKLRYTMLGLWHGILGKTDIRPQLLN